MAHQILHLAKTTWGSHDVSALRARQDFKLASRELLLFQFFKFFFCIACTVS